MSDKIDPDPDTFEALYLRLTNLERRSRRHAEEGQKIAKELLDLTTDMFVKRIDSPTRGTVKRESGRLTDEGIRALQAAFANGMRVSEAVAAFGISQSAASNRFKEWKASQKAVSPQEPPPTAAKPKRRPRRATKPTGDS